MDKKTPTKEAPKKEVPKQLTPTAQSTTAKEVQPEKSAPKPEPVKPMSLADIQKVVESLTMNVLEHTQQIVELQEALARKRKPVANGKVQIKDKQSGKIYPSKNNCYQTLLKSGELKELVDKGIFGPNPEKNTFGWYALVRELPDRFEEVKSDNGGHTNNQ